MQFLLGGAAPWASPTLIVGGIVMLAAFVHLWLCVRPRQGEERPYRITLMVFLLGGITVIVQTLRQISN